MKFKAIFAILFLLLNYCPLINIQAQENFYSKTFTTENGLPHNHVHSIAQDSTGFLWIATWDGLSRYDGYEFKNYYHNPSDTNSIAYFQVYKILVDFQNNVWILCGDRISKYNRASDNFTRIQIGDIGGIALDCEGKFWVSSKTGLYKWNCDLNQFDKIAVQLNPEFESLIKISSFKIAFDNENHLWLNIPGDESHFLKCNKFEKNALMADDIGIFENYKYAVGNYNTSIDFDFFVTPDSCFWMFNNYGIFKFNDKLKQFLPFPEFNVETDFSVLNENDIQSAIEKQLYYRAVASNNEINLKTGQFIESFLVDQQKTVWQSIVTNGYLVKGLTRNIPTGEAFKHYFLEENTGAGLNSIFAVLKDRFGNVWAGPTNVNQFFRMDKDGKSSKIIPIDNETWRSSLQPRSFLEDSTGIWIGFFYNLLLRYDFAGNKFIKEIFKTTGKEDRSFPLHLVHLKKEGDEIYIFGYAGIYKYNTKSRETNTLKLFELSNDFSLHSFLRDGKTWWTGMNKSSLIHYDNNFNEIGRFTLGTGNFNIEDIIQGDNNDLWISKLGGGLVHFEITTGNYRIYTTADGLSNNTCYGLLKDKRGNIWISTNHGISRFNPKTGKFRIFGPEDGLKIDEFNSDNTYLAFDGEMFFGGMGGVVSFYPDSIDVGSPEESASPLVITEFKVSGVSRYFKKAIYVSDSILLEKGDNNFQVTFACLDFINSTKIKYRYRLSGENNEFTETDYRNRSVNYASLSPGNYHLEIEATNTNGEWVSKTDLFIEIPPYYYQTWWFRVLIVFIVVAIIGYFIFTHERQLVLKARQQQDELKLESLRGQMNPHFIFNSLNSINYFISQNDRLAANRYIADFARLIRSILGNLSQEYIPLAKELESINDYLQLEHLRFGDKFDYEITVEENIQTEEFMVFPGMVQPFIENAIWHGVRGLEGRKGFVKIRFFTENPGLLCCVVEDDGIGRKLSEAHKSTLPGKTSRGIGIVLERLRIINHLRKADFKVIIEDLYPEKEESGTRVKVDIPVKGIANS